MIQVSHIPESEAVETARVVIRALGDTHPLARKWILAVTRLGYIYRPDLDHLFSRPV